MWNVDQFAFQHGPNSHPTIDEHGNHKYVDKESQSKINHYSKNQDTIILSSGTSVKPWLRSRLNFHFSRRSRPRGVDRRDQHQNPSQPVAPRAEAAHWTWPWAVPPQAPLPQVAPRISQTAASLPAAQVPTDRWNQRLQAELPLVDPDERGILWKRRGFRFRVLQPGTHHPQTENRPKTQETRSQEGQTGDTGIEALCDRGQRFLLTPRLLELLPSACPWRTASGVPQNGAKHVQTQSAIVGDATIRTRTTQLWQLVKHKSTQFSI